MIDFKIPADIESAAKEYMKDVIQKLEDNGLIEKVDNAALQMLARNYSTFIKASKQLEKDGLTVLSDRGNIAEHPCVKIARDAQNSAMKVMQEFGLTAKSRTKVTAKKEVEDNSPFAQFVKSGKK